jgi:hypothetical protein
LSSPVGAPLEVLERRLAFVRRNMNASQFYIENLPHALSQYTATQPPMFLWDIRLSADDRTFAGVHEMVHAVLHPPGSVSVGRNETRVEERIAHDVADRACDHFGVANYREFYERWKLQPSQVEVDELEGTELLLAALVETLESPDDIPSWLGRGNFSFGIGSLERAWASAPTAQ